MLKVIYDHKELSHLEWEHDEFIRLVRRGDIRVPDAYQRKLVLFGVFKIKF